MRAGLIALVGLAACLLASDALSCTQIFLGTEGQRYYQRQARLDADAVFLARATPDPLRGRTAFEPIVAVEGDRPPTRSFKLTGSQGNCGPTSMPKGIVIAFARRVRPEDARWKPWRWGRWHVFSSLYPSDVVDAELASAMREAAARLRQADD